MTEQGKGRKEKRRRRRTKENENRKKQKQEMPKINKKYEDGRGKLYEKTIEMVMMKEEKED